MPNSTPPSTETKLRQILAQLNSKDSGQRRAGLNAVQGLNYIDKPLAAKLENLAAYENQALIRSEALKVLRSDLYREFKVRWGGPSRGVRNSIIEQIETWEQEGLVDSEFANVLKTRYNYDFSPIQEQAPVAEVKLRPEPKTAVPSKPKEKSRSLGEILLSQGTINIALYLGTFLILAAALYYTAFSDALRVPILSVATALFGAGAFGLKRRLPSASFVLYIVYSLLIPILGIVILDAYPAVRQSQTLFWIGVNFFLLINWAIASRLYASELFSLLTFGSFNFIPFQLTQLLHLNVGISLMLAAISNLISMGVLVYLHNPKKKQPSDVVFPVSHLGEILLLLAAMLQLSGSGFRTRTDFEFVALFILCLLGITYYLLAQRIKFLPGSSFAASTFLFLLPWPLLQLFPFSPAAGAIFSTLWGSGFAILGHWLSVYKKAGTFVHYSSPLLFGSALLYLIAAIFAYDGGPVFLFTVPLCVGIVYAAVSLQKPRNLVWGTSLFAFLMAYLAFYNLPFMQRFDVFWGFVALWPALVFLLGEIWVARIKPSEPIFRNWFAGYGWILAGIAATIMISPFLDEPARTAIGFFILGLFMFAYGLAQKRNIAAYVSTSSVALAINFLLQALHVDLWSYVLFAVAVFYYSAGTFYPAKREFHSWLRAVQISGLALAVIVAFYTNTERPLQESMILFMLAIAVFLAAQIIQDKQKITEPQYTLFLRAGSAILVLAATAQLINSASSQPLQVSILFAIYGAMFATFAWLMDQPKLLYGATAFFSGSMFYFSSDYLKLVNWFLGLLLLALIFTGLGYLPILQKNKPEWSRVLRWSSLAIGVIVCGSAVLFEGPSIVLATALVATLFALEAWQQRKIGLAILADLLYIEAYFLVLDSLHILEPQFFSTGAAILGIVLHYLLRRLGEQNLTFFAGMASQLVLLGASYIQMVNTNNLFFFMILFFQALAVIIYGTIIRSRSLVLVPSGFVVLGVASIVIKAFSDVLSLLVIGCSGLLLLILGISALFLRERIGVARQKVRATFAEWSA